MESISQHKQNYLEHWNWQVPYWLKDFQALTYFLLLNAHLLQLLRICPFLWAERIQKIPELVKALGILEVSPISVLLPLELPFES